MKIRFKTKAYVKREGPFARHKGSMLVPGYTFVRKKEMRATYPMFEHLGGDLYKIRRFPAWEEPNLSWIKAFSAQPARPTWHSEKVRLNRYNRRKVREIIRSGRVFEDKHDLRPVRINEREIT